MTIQITAWHHTNEAGGKEIVASIDGVQKHYPADRLGLVHLACTAATVVVDHFEHGMAPWPVASEAEG